jgi:hypothetical protein
VHIYIGFIWNDVCWINALQEKCKKSVRRRLHDLRFNTLCGLNPDTYKTCFLQRDASKQSAAFLDYLLCRQLLNSFILEIAGLRKTKNGQKYVGFSFWGIGLVI